MPKTMSALSEEEEEEDEGLLSLLLCPLGAPVDSDGRSLADRTMPTGAVVAMLCSSSASVRDGSRPVICTAM